MLKTFLIILFLVSLSANSQTIYYQDIFHGGVCVTGTDTYDAGGNVNLPYYIEPSSQIKKIFLVSYALIPEIGSTNDDTFYIDGIPFEQSNMNYSGSFVENNLSISSGTIGYEIHVSDITNFYTPLNPTINVTSNIQEGPSTCPSCRYASPVLIILYENTTLPLVNYSLILNDGFEDNYNSVELQGLNACNYSNDVGLGIHSDRVAWDADDGYNFLINGNYVGYINGIDSPTIGFSGVIGCFYYQNNTLTGLTDDIADDIIDGSDGIMRLNNFITDLNGTQLQYNYFQIPNFHPHNVMAAFNLAYSTPCDTFSVSVVPDTTICPNIPLQLYASGGVSYKWEPTANLSCTTCPDPVFLGDSSMNYRVQIWNNDSCSVIRPVNVHVRPQPQFETISVQPSVCGTNNGSINLSYDIGTSTPVLFSMQGNPSQSSGLFSNLTSGSYTFQFEDGFGCMSPDTIVFIPEVNNTNASFVVSPDYGTAPLSVGVVNTSQNSTDYIWSINGLNEGTSLNAFIFDTSGTYEMQLVAWQFDPSCADTAYQTIIVIDQLIVPTAFTADNDGVNDFWELPNIDEIYPDNLVSVYDRWGVLLFQSVNGNYIKKPWDGKYNDEPLPVGSYFFIIETNDPDNEKINGVVSIIR